MDATPNDPFPLGTEVVKKSDGRKGIVVEVKDDRRRVSWRNRSDGKPFGCNLRTWVNVKGLRLAAGQTQSNGPPPVSER